MRLLLSLLLLASQLKLLLTQGRLSLPPPKAPSLSQRLRLPR